MQCLLQCNPICFIEWRQTCESVTTIQNPFYAGDTPNKCTETSISLINLGCSHNYLSYKPQTHNGVLTYINILLILFNYLGRLVNWVFFGFWHTSTSCIISLFFRESWISGAPKSCRVGISPEIDWNEKKRDDSSRGQIFGFDFQCMYGIGSKRCLVFHKGLQASAPYKPKKSWFVWCTGSHRHL